MKAALFALSLTLLLNPAAPASACGYHATLDGASWVPLHSKSLDVAMAVREAADRKLVDPALLDVKAAGPLGYLRATTRLRQFGLTLERPTSVLLVESGLWTRFEKGVPQFHAAGAQEGDAIIVTSEAVVAEILAGRMSVDSAAERGLIVSDVK
jgi:hypothetical protein